MRLLTFGAFDMCHLGHVRLLKRCARIADEVHVGLGTDDQVASYKRRPVLPYEQRAAILKELPWVTAVHRRAERDTSRLIAQVQPELLAVGSDWHDDDYLAAIGVTLEWLERYEIGIVYFPREESISSSQIRTLACP